MRLWHSGCETNELGSDLTDFGINATPTSRYQYDTAIKHGGLRSIKFNGTGPAFIQSPVFVGLTKAYARAYFYPVTTPPATTGILGFNSNITGHWAYFCLRPDMQIEVRVNTGLTQVLGGPSGWTLGLGGWSMLEMFCDTAGVVQGKINGALWYWAGTTFTTAGTLGTCVIGPSQSTPILHVDDIAVNDTTGSMNSSWCGAGEIHLQAPAKNMFNDQTVQPSGSAIEAINDLPGPIDDANYIHTTGMGRAGWWMTEMPVAGGVTAMLWGIRGGSTVATPLSTFLDIREATGLINFASFFDLGVNGWKTIYPVARAEGVWGDVTGRMLSASTRYVSGHMIQTGRSAASANPVRVSAVWCNVDVAMPLTPTTHPSRWGQRALTELETG